MCVLHIFASSTHVPFSVARLNLNLHSQKLSGGTAAKPCAKCKVGQTTHKTTPIRKLLRKESQPTFKARYEGIPMGSKRSMAREKRNKAQVFKNILRVWEITLLLESVVLWSVIWSSRGDFFNNLRMNPVCNVAQPRVKKTSIATCRIWKV